MRRTTVLGGMILLISALALGCSQQTLEELDTGQTQSIAPGAAAAVDADNGAADSAAPAIDKWALWTQGTRLRGANIYQRRVYPELDGAEFMGPGPVGPPFVQDDFDRLSELGANYVNISHAGLFTESPPYTLDQEMQDNLDSVLEMVAASDMFAVISFRTGPGRSEFTFFVDEVGDWFDSSYLNDSIWQDQAAQDAWAAMWRHTAQRYRDNPIVVGYDLMVEPNSNDVGSHALNDKLDMWDPEEFYSTYGGTLYDWNQLYPRVSAAIREVDPSTPILIAGMAYSSVDWLPYLEPTGDPRTVYTVHQYQPVPYTHQLPPLELTYPGTFDLDSDGIEDQFDRDWLDALLSTVDAFTTANNAPVAANEYGAMRWEPGAAQFMFDQMELFEQLGINYALWAWDPAWEPQSENDDFNFRHGPDPDNHTDVASSDLMDAISEYWERNTVRPSSAPTPVARLHGDIDCDGDVDAVDALVLLRHVAALPLGQSESCPEVGETVMVTPG